MNDAVKTCLHLYTVIVGLILLALLLGFPIAVAADVTTFVTVSYLLLFGWLVKVPFPGKLLPFFAAAALAADAITGNHAFIITLFFVLAFMLIVREIVRP